MAFDARGWLGTARLLDPISGAPDEAAVRAAFGRAYYSAFQFALSKLASLGIKPSRDDRKHQWILQILQAPLASPAADKMIALGGRLHALQKERTKADYILDDSSPFSRGAGSRLAEKAEIWIEEFRSIPAGDLKSAIRPHS